MELIIGFGIGSLVVLVLSFLFFRYFSKVQEDKFQLIASEIIQKNTEQIHAQAQLGITSIVNPLNERIKEYQAHVDSIHKFDIKDRETLKEKMNVMMGAAHKIEKEAGQLSRALSSDVKFQGAWGELTLERILEVSGLHKDVEYFTQAVLKDDHGNSQRPDVVIKLPNDANIIIDSKVSLTAYFDYMKSENKDGALRVLKKSIQTHIDSLSKKNYQKITNVNSPDFVYLFIPVEGVYSLILKEYPEMIDESLKKNIVLVSPVNIISNLKTVASLWRLEKQAKNADEMARKAGAMYDKLVAILDDFQKVGTNIQRAKEAHDEMIKKLSEGRGNLIGRAEELKTLGAKTTKEIDNSFLN